jgi:hypothetical protein
MWNRLISIKKFMSAFGVQPRSMVRFLRTAPDRARGLAYASTWLAGAPASERGQAPNGQSAAANPLRDYFASHHVGRGIVKWEHYFEAYDRHLREFVGREAAVLEVGIYSGGSLGMWRSYFGPECRVYGVDIEEACKVYEGGGVRVFIGDQADRSFWKAFKQQVGHLDIVIDDGGHSPEQQIVTLEEMLPHLRPGGVYICEDVHGIHNEFAAYASGLASQLNAWAVQSGEVLASQPTPFQSAVSSLHLYPFLLVIEKTEVPVDLFKAPKQGTEWQPFL